MTDHCPNCGFQLTPSNMKRAKRLPADWKPTDAQKAWAKNERRDIDVNTVADMFRDYWISKAGKDGAKLDWDATWRNWVRSCRSTPKQDPKPAARAVFVSSRKPVDLEKSKEIGNKINELVRQMECRS